MFLKTAAIQIPGKIRELLDLHAKDLHEAWARCGEEAFSISFPVKIWMDRHGKPACEVGISFVKERVKDSLTFNWDDHQIDLPKIGVAK